MIRERVRKFVFGGPHAWNEPRVTVELDRRDAQQVVAGLGRRKRALREDGGVQARYWALRCEEVQDRLRDAIVAADHEDGSGAPASGETRR
jgi:hypothetical protein